MARPDGADDTGGDGAEAGDGRLHADASDAHLTGLLRADTPTVFPALQEIRARHLPSVLAYARLCTTGDPAARQLAAQSFTLAARESARGFYPDVPLRHRLLLLTTRLAAEWARDERAAGVDPGLLLVLNAAGPGGPVPPMLAAFRSLPTRTQGLVWYGAVEREPVARTAALLGVTPEDVAYGTDQACQALAHACLRARLAASDDPRCGDFRRLIEESVRPDTPRTSPDLHAHMAHCAHCATAYEEQCALRDSPRTALAEGLLPWAGTAYTARAAAGAPGRRPPGPGPAPARASSLRSPSRRVVLASAACAVTLVPLLMVVLWSGGSDPADPQAAGSVSTPTAPGQVTVTATVPATTASPSTASPSPSGSTRTPRTTSPSPRPTATRAPTPTASPAHAPDGTYAQVVSAASGQCLDVADDFDNGTDVVMTACSSSPSQRWRVDTGRGVLQNAADSDFCLDSRGSVDRGVGVWSCSSVEGRNGQNLRFTVDDDGVIRPAVAIGTALTPDADGGLSLDPLTGGGDQRWVAGAS
ncbi:RICIN domain-containing protein [Streptomyces mangrovisoli]|uniref:Ricin-type beta-trefoil lectin domain protein n=1 Tax=Streptomyces mangrovisoli TaxID=1428628 RepID=A0A1J4NL92_9ACTN|nr:RICIN domain-containing protein [Streptomyces mangrovisoli]OIJ63032.1 ricin-type beta-trefoil lectin domain protein [Streptomyces mangrovisoli]